MLNVYEMSADKFSKIKRFRDSLCVLTISGKRINLLKKWASLISVLPSEIVTEMVALV